MTCDGSIYDENEHRHRFAAWCASRGAAAARVICSFTVKTGKELLEESGVRDACANIENLSKIEDFGSWHREMRIKLKNLAGQRVEDPIKGRFSHGVAAKLLNLYTKTLFLPNGNSSSTTNEICRIIHPPIDSLLLYSLGKCENEKVKKHRALWRKYRWSKLCSDEYEELISAISECESDGLWRIERHWPGHR